MNRIIHRYQSLPCPKRLLAAVVRDVYRREGLDIGAGVAIILCSDYMIRKLNREYRGKDKVTDVLSFHFGDIDLLGEIYISLQRVKVQAGKYGLTYNEELKRLLVHGLLHLAGYAHEDETERGVMEKRESEY